MIFQRIEAAVIFLATVYYYHYLHFNVWLFVLFLFSIDIFMLGYIKNNKFGAYIYNFGHNMMVPLFLLIFGTMDSNRLLLAIGLIWLAHIGWDRAFGYGLKFESGFKDTHLGNLGGKKTKKFKKVDNNLTNQ